MRKRLLVIGTALVMLAMAGMIALCYLLSGCGSAETAEEINGKWYVTPNGYKLQVPDCIFMHGLYLSYTVITDREAIANTLSAWLDHGIEEWLALRGQQYRGKAKSIHYTIHDHWFFKVNGDMCAGYFTGNDIDVALYHKYEGIDMPQMNYAAHTLIWHEDDQEKGVWKWYAGFIPEGGKGMSALDHELDHAIGIHHASVSIAGAGDEGDRGVYEGGVR